MTLKQNASAAINAGTASLY